MIRVVCIRNPFSPLDSREMRKVPDGSPLRELIAGFDVDPGYDIAASVDGQMATDMDAVPGAGSTVVFCAVPQGGEGKNPLALIAALALMVAVPALTGPILGGLGGIASGTAMIANMGLYVAGGLLISAIFPANTQEVGGSPSDTSPTYSWDVENNAASEGTCLPELFGTHRVTPPIIGHYISTADDKQYLNLLFAVAGHPVDAIASVRVNETAVEDMTGVSTETRLGRVTQPVLQHFADTRSDTAVGAILEVYESESSWTTRTTTGNTVDGLSVTLSFPRGLFYANDTGGMESVSVKVWIEYSIHDADSWTRLKGYNEESYTVTTPRWSGGEWRWEEENSQGAGYWYWYHYEFWDEMASPPAEPTEGAAYISDIWDAGNQFQPGHYKTLIWHQVGSQTFVGKGTVEVDYITITDNKTSPLHREFATGRLAPGRYDIRCCLAEDPAVTNGNTDWWGKFYRLNDSRLAADVYFEALQESVSDDFTYPGVSLLSVRALATDKLSGAIPKVDCVPTRYLVPVWNGAAYVRISASNPAWACYHLLHQARHNDVGDPSLASSYDVLGVPASKIDFRAFQSWAGWCDDPRWTDVNGVVHHLDPHTCNIYFDTAMSVRKALDIAGACGRGSVVQIGTKFTCIVDRPEQTPVQRFLLTPGNIVAGSFQEQFLPMQDRANAVEVTYFDAAQDYTRQSIEVYASDFDTTEREINKASVTLLGVTSHQKATDYARFLLNSNRYLTNTVSIEADVDSIASIPGDVIEIAHDVPQWGYGGRIVSATSNTVTIDRSVTLAGGTSYSIMVKHQDDDSREEKAISTGAGTYTTLSITGTFAKIPDVHALYSVGEVDHVVKEFRVLRIGTGQDLRRKITALEYTQEVYEDGAVIPEPELISDLPMTTGLTAIEVYRGGTDTRAYLKWRGYALFWNVFYRRGSSGPWVEYKRAYNPSCDVVGLDYGILYEFAVTHTDDPADGETVGITLRGKIDPPADVPWYSAAESINVTEYGFTALIEWGAVTDFDLWGYELRVETIAEPYPYPNFTPDWSLGTLLFKGNARTYVWSYKAAGSYCLHVRAVDAFGNISVNSTTHIEVIGDPNQPEASTPVFSGPNVILSWSQTTGAFAIDHFVIAYGDDYYTAAAAGTTKSTTFSINVTWGGLRRYWITAVDVAGNIGESAGIDVNVVLPGVIGPLTPRVIDNNVLLQWTAPTTGSLPIQYYSISKGDYYEVSESVGTVQGTFSAIFEQSAGAYTYWILGMDTAGNQGTPVGISASVNQPPDYNVFQAWDSGFDGAITSMLLSDGYLYAPVNITETIQEHFVNNSNDSPQDQIDAGYPFWIQPVPTTSSYQDVFDYGGLITSQATINLEVVRSNVFGEATITPSIEVSTDGVSYGTPVEAWSSLESGFRYVRVTLTVTGGGTDMLKIASIRVKLDAKLRTDQGTAEITTNPTTVSFNESFVDVVSITVTAEGTGAKFAIYDFADALNPTSFDVYLFNYDGSPAFGSGKYISWLARGIW